MSGRKELWMPAAAEIPSLARARERTTLALFTALAVAVHVAENLLPLPTPWFRLGLANILTLTALVWLGPAAAWQLTLMPSFCRWGGASWPLR